MKNRHIAFWLIATMFSSSVMAQNTLDATSKKSGQETTVKTDTLPEIMKEYDSEIEAGRYGLQAGYGFHII